MAKTKPPANKTQSARLSVALPDGRSETVNATTLLVVAVPEGSNVSRVCVQTSAENYAILVGDAIAVLRRDLGEEGVRRALEHSSVTATRGDALRRSVM